MTDDIQRAIRQWTLKRLCLKSRRAQPELPVARLREDHRHRLGMDCTDLGVRLGGREADEVGGDFALIQLAEASLGNPEPGEEGELPIFRRGEPNRRA